MHLRVGALTALTVTLWGCGAPAPEPALPGPLPPTLQAAVADAERGLAASGAMAYPEPLHPPDNPPSDAKARLGERLFSEPALSVTGAYSCASCHQPARHFTDGLAVARGATGDAHSRNTPTLYNAAFYASYGWQDDGVSTLEAQHLRPLLNERPVEMGFASHSLQGLETDPGYRQAFAESFGDERITLNRIVQAIATWVRTLRAPETAFDRYVYHDERDALTSEGRAGLELFVSARLGCAGCHGGLSLAGPQRSSRGSQAPAFHVTGVGGSTAAFRTPTLRAVSHTAPFMHDGSLATLEAVLAHYESTPAPGMPVFTLSDAERRALLTFLETL